MQITRDDIKHKLLDWQKGVLTAREIYDWANQLCADDANTFDDQEGDESAAEEVLFLLEVLDMNLSTAEDVPLYLQLLTTPQSSLSAGLKDFEKKFKARDLARRKQKLKSDPLYFAFID